MKRLMLCLLLALTAIPVAAQKIQNQQADRGRVLHLQTAMNHLTVIEASEPVVQVAAGSTAFKVEWRDNKVFVQPTESGVSTNLFIWTASERLNYELEPAGSVADMDFAVDQTPQQAVQPKPASTLVPQKPSPTDVLLTGTPVRMGTGRGSKRTVEVSIRDLYEKNGQVVIRYAVWNGGKETYPLNTPAVYVLDGVRSPRSLYGMVNSQLAEEDASRLKAKEHTPVPVVEGHVQASEVQPGQEAVGVVALALPESEQPRVLRLQFPDDGKEQVTAFLVR